MTRVILLPVDDSGEFLEDERRRARALVPSPRPPSFFFLPLPQNKTHTQTDDSSRAVQFVLDHIARPGDELRLVAVISGLHTAVVPGVDAPVDVPDSAVERAAREKAAEAFMTARFGPALGGAAAGITHRFEVLRFLTDTGSVADAVGARAAEVGAVLVALCGHHKSKLAKLFSGSVSDRLAATCPVPLLLVN